MKSNVGQFVIRFKNILWILKNVFYIPVGDADRVVVAIGLLAIEATLIILTHDCRPSVHHDPTLAGQGLARPQVPDAIERHLVVREGVSVVVAETVEDLNQIVSFGLT